MLYECQTDNNSYKLLHTHIPSLINLLRSNQLKVAMLWPTKLGVGGKVLHKADAVPEKTGLLPHIR